MIVQVDAPWASCSQEPFLVLSEVLVLELKEPKMQDLRASWSCNLIASRRLCTVNLGVTDHKLPLHVLTMF